MCNHVHFSADKSHDNTTVPSPSTHTSIPTFTSQPTLPSRRYNANNSRYCVSEKYRELFTVHWYTDHTQTNLWSSAIKRYTFSRSTLWRQGRRGWGVITAIRVTLVADAHMCMKTLEKQDKQQQQHPQSAPSDICVLPSGPCLAVFERSIGNTELARL